MREKLQFENKKTEQKLRGEELAENDTYSSLKKRKTNVLDRIFTSMANLTFFFKCIAEHPELNKLFEDDVKDLLGVRSMRHEVYGFMFINLLEGILMLGERSINYEKDFRLKLSSRLQKMVWDKVLHSSTNVFKTEGARKAVSDDFARVRAWTEMLADGADEDVDNEVPKRTFDFEIDELLKYYKK
jgi:hypothetical protein